MDLAWCLRARANWPPAADPGPPRSRVRQVTRKDRDLACWRDRQQTQHPRLPSLENPELKVEGFCKDINSNDVRGTAGGS